MINDKTILGVIVARGGSKRLPNKNILELGGRPLIGWTVAAAKSSAFLDRTILSSDDEAICEAAEAEGCEIPFRRPSHLATDTASAVDVMIHALNSLGDAPDPDYAVLLQATSPLRTGEDIDACIRACHERRAPACISVSASPKPPSWLLRMDEDTTIHALIEPHPPQDQVAYLPNGAVYVVHVKLFREHLTFTPDGTIGYIMPLERSVDIDVPMDLAVARAMIQAK